MTKIAIFPGSFDPFTKGHEDIVLRGLQIFDKIIIAVGYNSNKTRHFDIEKMLSKINGHYHNNSNIEVITYNELTAHLAIKHKAEFLLRGLRNTTDFEYENSISQVNRDLNKKLETVFLITSPEYAAINSSIVREVHKYGGDVSKYLPFTI
ncbi:MAG: pantetheine-phosphate adenylyltransferase [Cyclobacteriaceae bacterium]|nr:pantetheine-phosphate adenylyltransferase [Cyclobacteriaceae bacterium]